MRALIFFFLATVSALAQISPPAPQAASLEVSIQVLYEGYQLPDGEAVHAPADFYLSPSVRTTLPLHAGDAVTIDIYADGQKLLSQRAAWHEEFNPSKNARPGEAVPMIIQPAQFFYNDAHWTNVPEGKHVMFAQAYDFHGLSAYSKPMHIIVLPPLPPRPVSGMHEAFGPPRPALKPEQVRINHRAPRAEYQVVGIVIARAPGAWSREAAVTELKRQAAQLGANWVVLDKFHFVNPISKTNRVFIEREIQISGKALYVPSLNQSQTSNIEHWMARAEQRPRTRWEDDDEDEDEDDSKKFEGWTASTSSTSPTIPFRNPQSTFRNHELPRHVLCGRLFGWPEPAIINWVHSDRDVLRASGLRSPWRFLC